MHLLSSIRDAQRRRLQEARLLQHRSPKERLGCSAQAHMQGPSTRGNDHSMIIIQASNLVKETWLTFLEHRWTIFIAKDRGQQQRSGGS
jgi:hypothetical protein